MPGLTPDTEEDEAEPQGETHIHVLATWLKTLCPLTFKVDCETVSARSALSDTHRSRKGTRAADTSPLVSHADVGQESTEHQKREQEKDHVPL